MSRTCCSPMLFRCSASHRAQAQTSRACFGAELTLGKRSNSFSSEMNLERCERAKVIARLGFMFIFRHALGVAQAPFIPPRTAQSCRRQHPSGPIHSH